MVPQGPTSGNESLPQSTTIAGGRAVAWQGVAEPLASLLEFDVSDWADHGLQRIKERTVRSVFRGRLGAAAVHVKVFRADKLSDRARDALRGERGAREAAHLLRARELELPAVEPLAFGMARDRGSERSFVVTRSLADARTFDFGLPAETRARAGALLRRMHDIGALASDLHPGNLLVGGDGEPWLIDLTSFRHGGEPSSKQRAAALALFCQQLDGGPLDPAARPLLASYRDRGRLPPDFDDLLVAATRRWRAAALPAFGRRSERACRHTAVEPRRRGRAQWFWFLGGEDGDAEAERASARALADAPPEPAKSGRRGAVWLADGLVMKQRAQSLARKLWRASYWLLFARVPTPQPVALRLFRGVGHVVTARVDGPPLGEELERGVDAATVTALAADLGRSVGRLHAHGLRNRDLKLDNLVRVPGTTRVLMTDLDGVRRKAPSDTRGRGADLGRLLAAFRAAGEPGGARAVAAFVRGYLRAQRGLLVTSPIRRILRRAEQRAGEWASAHP